MLKPVSELHQGEGDLIKANRVIILLMTYTGLILTFGAVFPPLAVALLVTTLATTFYTKYKVGNFLIQAEEQNQTQIVLKIIES